jgi:putative heme-binding domain-containing protein
LAALASIADRDAGDPWTRTAILSSITGQALALLDALVKRDGFITTQPARIWLDELAFLVGCGRKPEDSRTLLRRLQAAGVGSDVLMRALLALGRGQARRGGSFASLIADPSLPLAKKLVDEAAHLAAADGPLDGRRAAIRLLGLGDTKTARRLFPELLDARQPAPVQLALLQAMASFLDQPAASEIVARWKAMSPSVRREAIEVLFSRPVGIETLIKAIESHSLAASEIDLARLRQLQSHPNPEVRDRARRILDSGALPARDRAKVVAAFRPAVEMTGDRQRGRAVFAKTCATCHQAEGQGVDVGPNLATVTNRSGEDLLVHILDPNREVAPNFVNYNVATAEGRVISGIITEESAGAIVVKRSEGATDVIPREQIDEVASTGLSLMPEGLEKGLSVQEFADLMAFVRSIRAGTK